MRKFMVKIAWFACPVLVLLACFERELRAIPNTYSYKEAYLADHADSVQVLVLGSSHGYYDVDPAYFTLRGFNLAGTSQSFDLDDALFTAWAPRLKNLQFVVLPVSYSSFISNMASGKERWRLKNYVNYYHLPLSYWPEDRLELLNGTMLASLGRVWAYHHSGRNDVACTALGNQRVALHLEEKNAASEGLAAAERHRAKDTLQFPVNRGHLRHIISLAQNRQARVLLFTAPAWHTYREHLDPRQWNQMQQAIKEVCADGAVRYVDLLSAPQFTIGDFSDPDHLNADGSKKLSLLLDSMMVHW